MNDCDYFMAKKGGHFKDVRIDEETDFSCVLLKTLKSVSIK